MKWDRVSRRHLLQGLGASLALPLLPSLLPRGAEAATSTQKTFIGLSAINGEFRMLGPRSELMPPTPMDYAAYQTSGVTAVPVAGRHTVHTRKLTDLASANGGQISRVIDASFTPYLDKMLLLQGFDYLANVGFHHTAHFGNAAAVMGASSNPAMATIDHVMAHSPDFYKNPALKGRTVSFTTNTDEYTDTSYYTSFGWSAPSSPTTSAVVPNRAWVNPQALWDNYFGAGVPASKMPLKTLLVDRVLGDYRALRTGNPRLGAEDRRRLDQHVDMLHQTQAKISSVQPMCSATRPALGAGQRLQVLQAMNDVMVSLIACGLCHSFVGWTDAIISSDPGDWHTWSHAAYDNDLDTITNQVNYDALLAQNKATLKDVCLDLAVKLDRAQLLDDTLILWLQEHNKHGHDGSNVPAVIFGSGGGALKTGQYIDYRDMGNPGRDDYNYTRWGYPTSQLLANVLQAMDVPPSFYEPLNKAPNPLFRAGSGYGVARVNDDTKFLEDLHYKRWAPGADLSAWLPALHG